MRIDAELDACSGRGAIDSFNQKAFCWIDDGVRPSNWAISSRENLLLIRSFNWRTSPSVHARLIGLLALISLRLQPKLSAYPNRWSRSHLINCAQYSAGFDRPAILHQDLRQNAGGWCSDLMRHIIGVDLDHGLADTYWVANALEPTADRQPQGACNLRHFYFCPHYPLISSPSVRKFDQVARRSRRRPV